MRFVPYLELGDVPNVIVDGSGTPSTVLTLSHWPGSRVPPALAADLSAEIVVRYLEQPDHHVVVDAVSNNHFDEDGLMGVWALLTPNALEHKELLVDVARAGDFGWSNTREAARIAFTIGSILDAQPAYDDYDQFCARMYETLLPRVGELFARPNAFREEWGAEDDFLTASDAAIERGDVAILEHPDVDLAIVNLSPTVNRDYHRFTQRRRGPIHPMAVHNRTPMMRVAYIHDRSYWVELRYESVVQFVSRTIQPRPDLGPLADRLNESETGGGRWRFESIGSLTPLLRLDAAEASSLAPETFEAELLRFLPGAAPAWDPWAEAGFR